MKKISFEDQLYFFPRTTSSSRELKWTKLVQYVCATVSVLERLESLMNFRLTHPQPSNLTQETPSSHKLHYETDELNFTMCGDTSFGAIFIIQSKSTDLKGLKLWTTCSPTSPHGVLISFRREELRLL